jgi:hypothetical protein
MIDDFLRELRRFLVLFIIRPVLLVCGGVISSAYNVLFAWWLDGWTFKGRQTLFEREIQREYSWIFEKYDARIIPTKQYRQVLDYVVATVAIGDLLFQFVRGLDDFHVTVAPSHAPHDSYYFGEAIDLACDADPTRHGARYYRMSDFRQLFEDNIERLKVFFSKEEYGQSRRDRTVVKLIAL